jgi:hypothetical protein
MTNSTVSGNHADSGGFGGGVGVLASTTLTNCTIAGNTAGGTYGGGGFAVVDATLDLINCTVATNTSTSSDGGGGIFNLDNSGTINLLNTIVAQNSATSGPGPDIAGAIASAFNNLIGDGTGSSGVTNNVNGNQVGGLGNPVIDPKLGKLQNNGGPTSTMALLPGSPAIKKGTPVGAPATDQRGVPRGNPPDIGAFELQATVIGRRYNR